jgi:hypothetical protein
LQQSFVAFEGTYVATVRGINNAGEIVGNYADASGKMHGVIGMPIASVSSPSISLLGVTPGPPQQASFSVVDPVTGIYSVTAFSPNFSAPTDISAFTPGQTTPITVTATKLDPNATAQVFIQAVNANGTLLDFDPAFLTVHGGGSQTETLRGVAVDENALNLTNGTPGLRNLRVTVNGHVIEVPLVSGERRTLSLRAWMTNPANKVEFAGEGDIGSSTKVMLQGARHETSWGIEEGDC